MLNQQSAQQLIKCVRYFFDDTNQYLPAINKIKLELHCAPNGVIFMGDEWGANSQFNGGTNNNAEMTPKLDNLRAHFNEFNFE